MHTNKIATLALAAMMLAGCYNPNITDSPEVEDLKKELAELRKSDSELRSKYIAQNEELSSILNELASITSKTSDLRLNVEMGAARLTQAEQISKSISNIKGRITALEKAADAIGVKNKEFQTMIDGLNSVLEEQRQQIDILKVEIETKNRTITSQKDTIAMQDMTIKKQMLELENTIAHQAKLLYEAGKELETMGDQVPEVSWKKNKEKVEEMRQNLYRKALEYYKQSYAEGYYEAKDRISALIAKIQAN